MKHTNDEMIELVLKDLEQWLDSGGDQSDDSMVYAFRHGYDLHAASLWLGTGASSEDLAPKIKGLKINHKAEMKEVESLIESADIFICPECNHHGFYEKGETDVAPICFSCGGNNMKLEVSK